MSSLPSLGFRSLRLPLSLGNSETLSFEWALSTFDNSFIASDLPTLISRPFSLYSSFGDPLFFRKFGHSSDSLSFISRPFSLCSNRSVNDESVHCRRLYRLTLPRSFEEITDHLSQQPSQKCLLSV